MRGELCRGIYSPAEELTKLFELTLGSSLTVHDATPYIGGFSGQMRFYIFFFFYNWYLFTFCTITDNIELCVFNVAS